MYSRKSVGPKMDPWGTPGLTGYSSKDFPSRTIKEEKKRRKEEITPNIWHEIPEDPSLWGRPACQTLSKTLDISRATARVAADLLKTLVILSDTTVRRSAVDWGDLKP